MSFVCVASILLLITITKTLAYVEFSTTKLSPRISQFSSAASRSFFSRNTPPTPSASLTMVSATNTPEENLKDLGLVLPPAPKPAANYCPCRLSGNLLYLSGHLPLEVDGKSLSLKGKVGPSANTVEQGYSAAQQVGLNLISTLKNELGGDLTRVERVVKLFGIVQSTDDFHEQHKVLNGCSDLFGKVFGTEKGQHARSAIGTNALPLDTAVEIEAIVQIAL